MNHEEPDGLNQYQRNSLEVTLRTLETLLAHSAELRTLSSSGGVGGLLIQRVADLTPAQRHQLAGLEQAARAIIAELKAAFGLTARTEDVRQTLYSQFASIWVNLEDTRPEKLRRYGSLDPQVGEQLRPYIEQLIELSLRFQQVLSKEQQQ